MDPTNQTQQLNKALAETRRRVAGLGSQLRQLSRQNKALSQTAQAAKSVAAATRSVAKAQRQLMRFDEINKLALETASGAAKKKSSAKSGRKSGSGSRSGGSSGSRSRSALDGMQATLSAWAKKVRKLLADLWSPFQQAWKNKGALVLTSAKTALEKLLRLGKSFGATWLSVWKDQAGTRLVETVLNIVAKLCQVAGNLADRIREAWEHCDTGRIIVETLFGIVQDVLNCVEQMVTATERWSKTLDLTAAAGGVATLLKSFRSLATVIGGVLADAYQKVLLPLASWTIEQAVPVLLNGLASAFRVVSGALSVLKPVAGAVWEHFLQPLAKWTGGVAISALNGLSAVMNKLGGFLSRIGDILSKETGWMEKLRAIGGVLVSSLKSGISSAFSGIGGWMRTNVVGKVVGAMSGLGGKVKTLFASAFSAACDAWKNIGSKFRTLAGKAVSAIKSGLGGGTLRDALIHPFRTALNGVISLVNRVISKINNALQFSWKSVRVAGVTLVQAGSVVLARLPHVGMLAQGGVLNRATPVIAGEAGAEAVVPLERNLGWLDKLAGLLAGKLDGNRTQPMVVQCVLDGRVIAASTVQYINQRARTTGINPLGAYL